MNREAWPVSGWFSAFWRASNANRVFLLIVAAFLAKQLLMVVIFPPFTGHDEVAHFAHIRTVATQFKVPRIPDLELFRANRGPVDPEREFVPADLYPYCAFVLDWDWCNEPRYADDPQYVARIGTQIYPWGWQYTANHPPLYYLAMAPLYRATDGWSTQSQLYLLRAAAIPFGLVVVLCAFGSVRLLFPRDEFMQIAVPAVVAFQPQISYEAAMVNNDIAGIAAVSVILYLLLRTLRRGLTRRDLALVGLALGIGLLFKSTTIITIPGIAIAIVLGTSIRRPRLWIAGGLLPAAVTIAVTWPWYLYLWQTYGNFSGLPQIHAIQVRWTYPDGMEPSVTDLLFDKAFAGMRWRETWGGSGGAGFRWIPRCFG